MPLYDIITIVCELGSVLYSRGVAIITNYITSTLVFVIDINSLYVGVCLLKIKSCIYTFSYA